MNGPSRDMRESAASPVPPEASQRALKRPRRWGRRLLRITLWLFLGLFLLGLSGGCEARDISAICPKCLQHARIYEVRLLGVPIYWETHLRQGGGGLGSPSTFSPGIPAVEPATYQRIHGTRCRHRFMYGGFGSNIGPFCMGVHADGAFWEWRTFVPRIVATEALYAAFEKTGDRQTALAAYRLIEEAYPLQGMSFDDRLQAARRTRTVDPYDRGSDAQKELAHLEEELGRVAGETGEGARVTRIAIFLRQMAIRLGGVTTAEDFRRVLAEFTPKLEGR